MCDFRWSCIICHTFSFYSLLAVFEFHTIDYSAMDEDADADDDPAPDEGQFP